MGEQRTVIIINPAAQNGALGRRWPELCQVVRRHIPAFEEQRTEAAGDATRMAREAIESGADQIVAVGGDGTVNEVVNGFVRDGELIESQCALGLIPFGTGGDFRRTVRVPKDVSRAAEIIAAGETRRVDLGIATYALEGGGEETRAFLNIASFGLPGEVDKLVNESSKALGGKLSFMLATVRAGLRYDNRRVRLFFDDDDDAIEMTISSVAVANGRYFGGGMKVAPEAELDDGFFDVVAVGDLKTSDFLLRGHRLYRGTHLSMDKVSSRRAKKLVAEPLGREPVRLDLDGENPGQLPATFQIEAQAIDLIVP